MFISTISDEFSFLVNSGFVEAAECCNEQYDRISWTRDDVRIVIENERYHYALILSIYFQEKEIDVNKLFEAYDLPYRRKYEYPDKDRIGKAITYLKEAVEGFITKFTDDPEGMKAAFTDLI